VEKGRAGGAATGATAAGNTLSEAAYRAVVGLVDGQMVRAEKGERGKLEEVAAAAKRW